MDKLIETKAGSCPRCGGIRFNYNSPLIRRTYKGKAIVGKYECVNCGWQSGLHGERDK